MLAAGFWVHLLKSVAFEAEAAVLRIVRVLHEEDPPDIPVPNLTPTSGEFEATAHRSCDTWAIRGSKIEKS